MTRYLISFDDGAMAHIPNEDFPDVARAAHEVVQEAVNAGVWVSAADRELLARPRTRRDPPPR